MKKVNKKKVVLNQYQKYLDLLVSNNKDLKEKILIFKKGKKQIQKGVFVGKNLLIEPNVFFDTSEGEIVIDDNTKIKVNSVLRGPLYIGKNCLINSFTEVSHSQIGDVCKIGGEIEASIIQSYSNKQHHGYLGNSYIGSWVNIGAGTNISNLKNSYETIKIKNQDTGLQFLGCIMGDYSKTAINTSIFCGKVIGESSHLYGTVTEDIPAFTNHIRPGVLYEIPLIVAIKIQKAMMKRRGLDFTITEENKLQKIFTESIKERKLAKVKVGKLSFK